MKRLNILIEMIRSEIGRRKIEDTIPTIFFSKVKVDFSCVFPVRVGNQQ